jgi:hypothetical protein
MFGCEIRKYDDEGEVATSDGGAKNGIGNNNNGA